MKQGFILSFDQGTTSSRAILFSRSGEPVASARKEFTQIFPRPGWVEHDPEEIWATQAGVAAEVLTRAGAEASEIAAIGITNQRETTVVWNRKTGKPVYNAIVWQDRRTAGYCDSLMARGLSDTISGKTGLIIDAYFSATKLRWILENVSGAREMAVRGELAFGTVDSWLLWNLTGGRLHMTDVSNASRTMLFNIHTLEWDRELLELFGIPESVLPEVRSSSEVYGLTSGLFASQIPVSGIAGDQQAALFGQMCTEEGMVKNTYGTGCFMMMNTGTRPMQSANRLLTTVAWQIGGETVYAIEGSIFIGGAVVQWLRDGLGIIRQSAEVEELASMVSSHEGIYFVPAFAGLGAPYWNQHARGTITGLTRGATAAHIARAAIDSIAYQVLDVLLAMEKDSCLEIKELRVDGGATVNDRLMQFQADLLQADVVRSRITETTALGAACLAGLATGFWGSVDELKRQWQAESRFTPAMQPGERDTLVRGWHRAVRTAVAWAGDPEIEQV
ncbi:MAG: glycerol kinase GlpK [Bacteroidales bacterium]|jgi:glycerol kinase|nr:glycerol kinase GlpK [Bacteroidales bacterium]